MFSAEHLLSCARENSLLVPGEFLGRGITFVRRAFLCYWCMVIPSAVRFLFRAVPWPFRLQDLAVFHGLAVGREAIRRLCPSQTLAVAAGERIAGLDTRINEQAVERYYENGGGEPQRANGGWGSKGPNEASCRA
jgi:hypothetical protein